MNAFRDPFLAAVADKVDTGERLSFDEGVQLFETDDFVGLGRLADEVRRRRHGRATYYNVNRHLNYTNVCYWDCTFCSFYRKKDSPEAYTHSIDDCLVRAREAAESAIASPLLENVNLAGAKGLLVSITGGMDMTIGEFEEVGNTIKDLASDDANVVVGTTIDHEMKNELRVTIVATGIGQGAPAVAKLTGRDRELRIPAINLVRGDPDSHARHAVSYTHLTLPTSDLV